MISYLKTSFIFFVLIITGLSSCSNKDNLNKKLQGSWIIRNAARNGRITYTLEGAYLKLYDDNYIETNIYGDPIITNYIFKENILVSDSILSDIFVDKVNMDTLWLHMTIRENLFSLQLLNTNKNEKNIPY